jgi:anti-sigma factor RsiW
MAEPAGNGAHVIPALGLYLLGALRDTEVAAVEDHLFHCPRCLREADALGPAVEALTLMQADEALELLPETAPPPVPSKAAPHSPADRRPPNRPDPRASRHRRRALIAIGGLASVVVLTIGMALGLALGHGGGGAAGGTPTGISMAAAAADNTTGATLSVVVTAAVDGGTTVHATVSGLRDGERYELVAVTVDGTTSVVSVWLGATGARDLADDIPVAPTQLAFFAIARGDGTPVVSAYLPRPTPS